MRLKIDWWVVVCVNYGKAWVSWFNWQSCGQAFGAVFCDDEFQHVVKDGPEHCFDIFEVWIDLFD